MEHSASELDEADLAPLYGNSSENNQEGKAWKGAAWEAPERIYETGPTGGPKNKAKSVVLTEEGRRAPSSKFAKHLRTMIASSKPLRVHPSKPMLTNNLTQATGCSCVFRPETP